MRTEPPELPRERDGAERDGADLEPEEIRAEEREPEEGAERRRVEDELDLGAENTERGDDLKNELSGELPWLRPDEERVRDRDGEGEYEFLPLGLEANPRGRLSPEDRSRPEVREERAGELDPKREMRLSGA